MALSQAQKSALEIGSVIVAGGAVLWWITRGAAAGQSTVTTEPLPVYGGSADPNSIAAAPPSVAPIPSWPTFPAFPNVGGANVIYPPSPPALPGLIQLMGPGGGGGPSGCCCGSSGGPGALVPSTPYPWGNMVGIGDGVNAPIYPPRGVVPTIDLMPSYG